MYTGWLALYSQRTFIIERTLQAFYVAISFFVALTLAIAFTGSLGAFFWLPTSMVIIGVCMLLVGTASLIWETTLSAGSIRAEIASSSVNLAKRGVFRSKRPPQ